MGNKNTTDVREIQIADTVYSLAIMPFGDSYLIAWECPICKPSIGQAKRAESESDALSWAEAMALTHHSEFHRDNLTSKLTDFPATG